MKRLWPLAIPLLATSVLAFESADKVPNESLTPSLPSNQLDSILENLPEYEYWEDMRTIQGVDNNKNGIRDALEVMAYGLVYVSSDATVEDYYQVLELVNFMQPRNPIEEDSLSLAKMQCDFLRLPSYIHSDVSFDLLYNMVANSKLRLSALAKSIIHDSAQTQDLCSDIWTSKSPKILFNPSK